MLSWTPVSKEVDVSAALRLREGEQNGDVMDVFGGGKETWGSPRGKVQTFSARCVVRDLQMEGRGGDLRGLRRAEASGTAIQPERRGELR